MIYFHGTAQAFLVNNLEHHGIDGQKKHFLDETFTIFSSDVVLHVLRT